MSKYGEPWVHLGHATIGRCEHSCTQIEILKRTVACVNALSGVPDPAALMVAVREVVAANADLDDAAAHHGEHGTFGEIAKASNRLDAALRRLGEVMG